MVQSDEIRTAFVKRLKAALAHAGIADWGAGARLAKIAHATPKAASKWLNGESMPGRPNMLAISEALSVRSEWLEYGWGQMLPGQTVDDIGGSREHSNVAPIRQPYKVAKEYPLISWVVAGAWEESCDNFSPGDADEWLESNADAGPNGYWLEVRGLSMLAPNDSVSFPPKMRILVRPEGFDLTSGKYYIAKLIDTGETTFKQYIRDAGVEYLQPLNPNFKTIEITDSVRIIGRVMDAKLPKSLF